MVEIGATNTIVSVVGEKDTAKEVGSGTLRVLATPRLIALMEECAYKCIENMLDEGTTSVGTEIEIQHLAATPVGMKYSVRADVLLVEGRKITFKLAAHDENGIIAEGMHERFIVFEEKFIAKTYSKLK